MRGASPDIAAAPPADRPIPLRVIAERLGMSPAQAQMTVRGGRRGPNPDGPRPMLSDEVVRERFERGETEFQIALATGFTAGTVRGRLYHLGLMQPVRRDPISAAPGSRRATAAAEPPLTDRQAQDVAVLMAQGRHSRASAIELVLRPRTKIRLRAAPLQIGGRP